ncbi:hypothetical protein EDD86DRAFT_202200 [Gorgonomyces haynaldii]|nr:hypothetical protein EDD86DRAFT_202200 [Gorgonomyces haynaldii]
MHILFATEYLPPYVSGISNRCKNLINGYRKQGHQVTVCSVEKTDCDIPVVSVPNPFYDQQRIFVLPPFKLIWELLDFTKPVPYDICHVVAPLCFSFVWVLPLLRMRGVKIYVSYHVYLEYYYQHYCGTNRIGLFLAESLFTMLYYWPLVYLADCVGIPSKTADGYVFRYSKRIHYLKSGLDVSVFKPADVVVKQIAAPKVKQIVSVQKDSDFFIKNIRDITGSEGILMTYVGRLAPEKNVEFLVKAMSHPLLKNARLCIVGDGPSRKGLEELAMSIVGKEDVYSLPSHMVDQTNNKRVVFTGMILDEHQVASYYAQSDVFVSASASETFGFTVAEAMACSTPAVVVRSGAFETVYKMIDDWMFEPGNEHDFANKVVKCASNPSLRPYARQTAVQGFGVDAAVSDLLQTYQSIISSH